MNRVGKWTLFFVLLCIAPVVAAQLDCPSIVQAALDATDEQCSATSRNQACYGNVNLQAAPQPGVEDFTFSTPGDIVAVSAIESFSLSSQVEETGEWGVALMQLQANIPDTLPGQNVAFLLFGDVQITNGVESNTDPVTFDLIAVSNVSVHSGPSADDEIVADLAEGDLTTAIGRNTEGTWVQVSVSGVTGWVTADEVEASGDVETLNIINPAGFRPMQAFYFQSGIGDAPCAEAPDSGILVQTPEGVEEIEFTVNDVHITLGSTAYLQAQPSGDMTTSVVEGEATVEAGGASVDVPAGSYVNVPLDADGRASGTPSQPQPYDPAKMALLPIRILPRTITVAAPISGNTTAGVIPAAGEWQWTNGTPSQEGCPPGVVEMVVPTFTPRGPFRLPGDEFNLLILFGAAFGQSDPPPNAAFSNPDPNTYIVDFSDGGGNGHYEVRVLDTEHIEGQLQYTSQGCSMAIPFEVTLVGGGIIPAAGEWQWTTGEPSSEGCEPGIAETLVTAMSTIEPFQLPGDEFSLEILLEAASGDFASLPNAVFSNPDSNTYVVEYGGGSTHNRYTVRVVDTDHIEGQFNHTFEGCSVTIPFEVNRVGD